MPRVQLRLLKQCNALWDAQPLQQARRLHRSFKPEGASEKSKAKSKPKITPLPKSNVSSQTSSAISLLDELFPELAKQNIPEPKPKPEREIPRLPLYPGDAIRPQPVPISQFERGRKQILARVDEERTVLVLRSACKSLIESDFRRLVPKGKHIEGWLSKGEFEKVIPARDPETLRLLGSYFLIFSNPAAAKAYQENVGHIHRIARTYTPRSLQSPIPPPPGMLIDGEDVHTLIQSYALIPPGHNLRLNMVMRPLTPLMRQIVEHGGYNLIASRPDRSEHEILLSFDGEKQPTPYSIQTALGADGMARGRSWAFAGGWPPKITKLDMPGPWREDREDSGRVDDRAVSEYNYQDGSDHGSGGKSGYDDKRKNGVPKWIIAMESDAEAKRFARSWHRRPLPTRDPAEYDGQPPMMNAELLW